MKKCASFLVMLAVAVFSMPVLALQLPGPLVDVQWLAANQGKVIVLDVRHNVKSFKGKPGYRKNKKTGKKKLRVVAGHIPGARLINYGKIRKTVVIDGKKVEKMLLPAAEFEKIIRAAGVNKGSAVVIVSRGQNNLDMTMATRLYWQMKYYGHDNLAILDGGTAGWILAGHKTSSRQVRVKTGNWKAGPGRRQMLATTADVSKAVRSGKVQLVDNRPLDLYMGTWKKSYVYAKGHIPGAKSFPNSLLVSHGLGARFINGKLALDLMAAMRVDPKKPTITYCNSGHLASGGWFIMSELLGNKQVKLYDGSMHEWTLQKGAVKALVME